jgi:hypothetical protein
MSMRLANPLPAIRCGASCSNEGVIYLYGGDNGYQTSHSLVRIETRPKWAWSVLGTETEAGGRSAMPFAKTQFGSILIFMVFSFFFRSSIFLRVF